MADSSRSLAISPWAASQTAAAELGLSRATLYRRIAYPHWVEGRHYRWIQKGSRRVLQFHLGATSELIRRRGW